MSSNLHPNTDARRELARQLHGRGLEFGPGCHPLPLGPFVESIRYCDRFDRTGFEEMFPEVGDAAGFPEPIDYLVDFDQDWFVDAIGADSLDFIVANHVLEHLVNPIRFLEQCRALLVDGGLLLLGIPDKRRTFDRDRQRTRLTDLVARYEINENVLSAAAVEQYVNQVDRPGESFGPDSAGFAAEVDRHRRRSLHVNVWIVDDIIELLSFLGNKLAMPWELHDGLVAADEFLLVLRKTDDEAAIERYPITMARIWSEGQRRFFDDHYRPRLEELQELCRSLHHQLLVTDERVRECQNLVGSVKKFAGKVPIVRRLRQPRTSRSD